MTDTDGQLRRRILAGVAAVALVLVGVVVGLVLGGDDGDDGDGDDVVASDETTTTGDDDGDDGAPPRPTAVGETTSTTGAVQGPVAATPQGRELIALIDAGQAASYAASYRTTDASNQLGTVQVEVWRDGDRVRQDARVQVDGREVETAAFIDGEAVRVCQRAAADPGWQCQDVDRAQVPDVDGRIRTAVTELADRTSGGTDATIAGQPSRCYSVIDENDDPVELCVTLTGVPARFVAGDSSIELLSYGDGVPAEVFTPPG